MRKLGHGGDNSIFNIFDYDLKTLQDLINLINDYETKKPPSKKIRRTYPNKMKMLPNILEDLEDLNNMTQL